MMLYPFLDLKKVNSEIEVEIRNVIEKVLLSGWYILGEACNEFEKNMKTVLSGKNEGFVTTCNSGTDALILSLLSAGVGLGDEVVTVSHTAIPTICAINAVGAKPVYIDIDSKTWLMDISLLRSVITPKTKAIVPVHLYGNMVDVDEVIKILCEIGRTDVAIVEDVAQALGSVLSGKQAGTIGRFGAFSFYPSKNIGALGDGGAVFCGEENDSVILHQLRNYGQKNRYQVEVKKGLNSRLDEFQAAILNVKLKYLQKWIDIKSQLMNEYKLALAGLPIEFQAVSENCIPAWHLCVIRLESEKNRNDLLQYLRRHEIDTLIHYPIPNHLQKAFLLDQKIHLPVTEDLTKRILSLAFNTALSSADYNFIIDKIQKFFNNH
jgi:dTDP-4-amino-4,6-dideoxygalactose transaminase